MDSSCVDVTGLYYARFGTGAEDRPGRTSMVCGRAAPRCPAQDLGQLRLHVAKPTTIRRRKLYSDPPVIRVSLLRFEARSWQ